MPELPEVETVRRGLIPVLEGRRLRRVTVRRKDLRIKFPPKFAERLEGRRILRLTRRAKYILAELDSMETLIVHLGMSGRITIHAAGENRPGNFLHKAPDDGSGNGPHDHVIFETEDGARVVYTDARRFGLMTLVKSDELPKHKLFSGVGPEPLDDAFDAATLAAALKGKKTPIKAALLDQRVVAGLGNIYVCEALYRAGISPKRLAKSVSGKRSDALLPEIKKVLAEAVEAGGSTLRDFAGASGELGYFQHRFRVYGREGKPCLTPDCGGKIRRIVQSGRSTFFCPVCQT